MRGTTNSNFVNQDQPTDFSNSPFYIGDIFVEPQLCCITNSQDTLAYISRRQMKALILLANKSQNLVDRGELHRILCLSNEGNRDRGALSHHIRLIRRALGDDAKNPKYIKTIRGSGYTLLITPSKRSQFAQARPLNFRQNFTQRKSIKTQPLSLLRGGLSALLTTAFLISLIVTGSTAADKVTRTQLNPSDKALQNALVVAAKSGTEAAAQTSTTTLVYHSQFIRDNDTLPLSEKIAELFTIADSLLQIQAWEQASQILVELLEMQRNDSESDPSMLAATLLKLAQTKSVLDQTIDLSRNYLVEAEQLIRSTKPSSLELAKHLAQHAALAGFDQDFERAQSLIGEAIAMTKKSPVENQWLTLNFVKQSANYFSEQGKVNKAYSMLSYVFQKQKNELPPHSIDTALTSTDLARLASKMGQHEKAANFLEAALSIFRKQMPDHHPMILQTKIELANILRQGIDYERAISLHQDVIHSVTQYRKVTAGKMSSLRLGLAEAFYANQQFDLAIKELNQVFELLESDENVPSWISYFATSLYGSVLIETGQCEKGIMLLSNAANGMFIDKVKDPRITSVVFQRKNRYSESYFEHNAVCA